MGILLRSLGLAALSGAPTTDPTGAETSNGATVRPPLRSDRPAVSLASALTLPAVYRSVQIISGLGAQLDIVVERAGQVIEPPALAQRPDPWRTRASWVERIIVGLAGDGNAFLRITRDERDQVVALTVLNPFEVHVRRDRRNRKFYDVVDNGRPVELRADQVLHLWAMEVPGADRGLGPIGYCRASIEGALDTRDYAADVFRSGRVSAGSLSTEQPIDPATMKEYQRLHREHDPRDVRVYGRGLKYAPVAINPKDAQWLESQSFAVIDVARMFGIPAPLLEAAVAGDSLTYQTLLDVNVKFLATTLFPVYLRKIEDALTEALPRGQRARFDDAALLRPDAKARMEIHGLAIDHGIYGPEHARDVERISHDAAPATPAKREETPA